MKEGIVIASQVQERTKMRQPTVAATADWRDEIFVALRAAEIRQVGYVPDAGHARLSELCRAEPTIRAVPLTTEEAAETCAAALDIAFNGDLATAVLLSQRLLGAKRWVK